MFSYNVILIFTLISIQFGLSFSIEIKENLLRIFKQCTIYNGTFELLCGPTPKSNPIKPDNDTVNIVRIDIRRYNMTSDFLLLFKSVETIKFGHPALSFGNDVGIKVDSLDFATKLTHLKSLQAYYVDFSGLPLPSKLSSSLKEMTLCCRMPELAADSFSETIDLEYMILTNSDISLLFPDMFQHCKNLKQVNFTLNSIVNIENVFHNLQNLETLDMSHNRIRNITNLTFKGSSKLSTISLAYNQLENIESEAFLGLTKLIQLKLKSNMLVVIDLKLNVLSGIQTFQLQLDENPLQSIDLSKSSSLPTLQLNLSTINFDNIRVLKNLNIQLALRKGYQIDIYSLIKVFKTNEVGELEAYDHPELGDFDFEMLNAKKLRSLKLYQCGIKQFDIVAMHNELSSLNYILLRHDKIQVSIDFNKTQV